jgi:hypothetical protein
VRISTEDRPGSASGTVLSTQRSDVALRVVGCLWLERELRGITLRTGSTERDLTVPIAYCSVAGVVRRVTACCCRRGAACQLTDERQGRRGAESQRSRKREHPDLDEHDGAEYTSGVKSGYLVFV